MSSPAPADDTVSVLVVDDEPVLAESCVRIARGDGYFATSTGRGWLALEHVRQRRPEIVLVAQELPDMHGITLLGWIRSIAPEILVIMIIGSGAAAGRPQAIQAGAFDCLVKPFTATRLRILLGRASHQARSVK
ncbi:MAG TPA: response regulator [Longimicrobiaceae bacterium]|jgi:DNA-binding NtrC family response regulator